MCSAIVKVPQQRLTPIAVRNIARNHWGLTKEQMVGMEVHHFPPRCEGGKDIPEHLYVCSREVHRTIWHNDAWFMENLAKATIANTGRVHSKSTRKKRSESLKGRQFGNNIPGVNNKHLEKKVIIEGVVYESQREAAKVLGLTEAGLTYRMKNWGPSRGYEYGR